MDVPNDPGGLRQCSLYSKCKDAQRTGRGRGLPEGHVITSADIKAARLLARSLPEDIIMDRDLAMVPGSTLLRATEEGQPITKSMLKNMTPKARESSPLLQDLDLDGM
ncbi:MAG: flagella basal body P-ring formation protein FlgA [Kiritimatiellae bacterium]|nr:flagella basal body P-ring formation protein FlgA [Kiritimatiellia bacterium]